MNKGNTPRRKRLNQNQRISVAEKWIKTYIGKNIVKGYSNWFGVDLLCAIKELRLLGQNISEEYENQVRKSHENKILARENAKEKRMQIGGYSDGDDFWENEFEFITGSTSNGVPYGIKKCEDGNTKMF